MNLTHAPLTNWGLGLIEFQDGWTMLDVGFRDWLYVCGTEQREPLMRGDYALWL